MNKIELQQRIRESLLAGKQNIEVLCQRIVDLQVVKRLCGVEDPLLCARADAEFMPRPLARPSVFSPLVSVSQFIDRSGAFGKVARYVVAVISWSYSINLNEPPTSRWVAQSQVSFIRAVCSDAVVLTVAFRKFFSSIQKAAAVAAGIVITIVGIALLYRKFQIATPHFGNEYFRDLTVEVREGRARDSIGRSKEVFEIVRALSPPADHDPGILFLVGPPGVGKTQLMEGLAYKIVNHQIPTLEGKIVLAINTANLFGAGRYGDGGVYSNRVESLFIDLQGFEKQVILFFDEAHNMSNSLEGMKGAPLIEGLKTKLLEKKILCVFATTEREYTQHIAPNAAFCDRTTRVDIPPLSPEDTITVLRRQFQATDNLVSIDPSVYEQMVTTSASLPGLRERAEPRKSLQRLQSLVRQVYAWLPQRLSEEIEAEQRKLEKLVRQAHGQSILFPGWSQTEEGKATIAEIRTLKTQMRTLQTQQAAQRALFEQIKFLQRQEARYRSAESEVVHLLAKRGDYMNPTERDFHAARYLLLQRFILPTVRSVIQEKATEMERDFGEKMPLKVDDELVLLAHPSSATCCR